MPTPTKRPVVVTTEHKGVFFGYCTKATEDTLARTITLTDAQMCLYWSSEVKSVMGLASVGPSNTSRVSSPVPKITLTDTTSVMDATDKAVTAWQQRPWK